MTGAAIGERLKARRESAGLGVRALARKAGIAHSYIVSLESGKVADPSTASVAQIAIALGISSAALLGEPEAPPAPATGLRRVAFTQVFPSIANPRREIDTEAEDFKALVESIAERGVEVPLIVRPWRDETVHGEAFEIVAGERRWRALRTLAFSGRLDAKATLVPVDVRELDDAAALELAVIENVAREAMPPLDEAAAIKRLLELGRYASASAAGRALGKTPEWAQQRLKLLDLEMIAQQALQEGLIGPAVGRLLARAPAEHQAAVIRDIRRGWIDASEDDVRWELQSLAGEPGDSEQQLDLERDALDVQQDDAPEAEAGEDETPAWPRGSGPCPECGEDHHSSIVRRLDDDRMIHGWHCSSCDHEWWVPGEEPPAAAERPAAKPSVAPRKVEAPWTPPEPDVHPSQTEKLRRLLVRRPDIALCLLAASMLASTEQRVSLRLKRFAAGRHENEGHTELHNAMVPIFRRYLPDHDGGRFVDDIATELLQLPEAKVQQCLAELVAARIGGYGYFAGDLTQKLLKAGGGRKTKAAARPKAKGGRR